MSRRGKRSSKKKSTDDLPVEIQFHIAMTLAKADTSPILYKYDADRFNFKDSIKLRSKSYYLITLELVPTPAPVLR